MTRMNEIGRKRSSGRDAHVSGPVVINDRIFERTFDGLEIPLRIRKLSVGSRCGGHIDATEIVGLAGRYLARRIRLA